MQHVRTKLKNGVRVIIAPMPNNPLVTVLAGTDTGVLNENRSNNGISHFLEHVCFKGSKHRSNVRLLREIDNIGGDCNAHTDIESTAYYLRTDAGFLDRAIDIVSDLFVNPNFPSEQIERERGVVLAEFDMYDDEPAQVAGDFFPRLLFGDQPAGWPVLGSRSNVKRITREDLAAYRQRNYSADASYVIVAGGVDAQTAIDLLERSHLAELHKTSKRPIVQPVRRSKGLVVHHINRRTKQTHICAGFEAYPGNHEDSHVMSVISAILDGGMYARIPRRIREELGLAYYVSGNLNEHRYHGYYCAVAGVHNGRSLEGMRELCSTMIELGRTAVPEEEFVRAKGLARRPLLLETSDQVAMFYSDQESCGSELETPEETLARIDSVTAEDVLRVAGKLFTVENLHVVSVGPKPKQSVRKVLLAL